MPQSMQKFKKQLKTSLGVEGADIIVEEIPEDVPEGETVSADAIETIGDKAEVQQLDNQAEDLATVDELGEELVVAVESALATGKGLRPLEAVALRLTTKQLTGKYTSAIEDGMPAREEFGGTADAYDTTVLAVEGLKSGISAFWETAKAQFLKIIETIQKLFRKVMSLFVSVTKRAQALKARAEEMEGEEQVGTVKINTTNLKIGGQDVSQTSPTGLKNIFELVNALLKSGRQIDDRAEVNKGVDAVKDENSWKAYVQGVNSYARRTFDAVDSSKEGVSTLLPGNRAVTFTEGQPDTRDQFSFESLIQFGDGMAGEEVQDVQALGRKSIVAVADLVIMIAEKIGEYDKIWNRSATKAARLVQGINNAVKAEETKDSKEEDASDVTEKETRMSRFKVNVSALIAHVRRIDKFSSDLIAYAQSTSNDMLSYGEKSLTDATTTGSAVQTTE